MEGQCLTISHDGLRGYDSPSEVEMGKPRGKTGQAQTGTRYISAGRKIMQKENEATVKALFHERVCGATNRSAT
jgi:hypothetical protein